MTPERRAILWLLAMCAVWGSSFSSMKLGAAGVAGVVGEGAAPSALIFLRFLVSAALFPLVFPRALRQLTPGAVGWGLLLTVPFYAGFILQITGLQITSSTTSAFLTSLTVILTPLAGFLLFRERVSWGNAAGAVIALAGVYVLTNPAGATFGRGEVLGAACAVAFTFQIQLTNIVTRRQPPEAVTFVMFAGAAAISGATLAVLGVPARRLWEAWGAPNVAWSVLYNATACSILAITIMNRFQRDLAPTRAAVLYTVEPVFAAIFAGLAVAFLPSMGERLSLREVAGGAVILAGNLVCELWRKGPVPFDSSPQGLRPIGGLAQGKQPPSLPSAPPGGKGG